MKKFFKRYGHWVSFLIIAASFFSMFIDFEWQKLGLIAVVLGGIGTVSILFLAIVAEKNSRKENN